MAAHEFCFQSISQLSAAIKAANVSPVELTQAYLERIQKIDPQLNSYITVAAEQALQEAKEAERQISQNGPRGPLHGIPLAHKDIMATKGMLTTDALLTPGELIPAPRLDDRSVMIDGREVKLLRAIVSATSPFNLTGQPALTVPCGLSSAGLPLALQIVGKPFDEATILQIGHAYEVYTSWHEQQPPMWRSG